MSIQPSNPHQDRNIDGILATRLTGKQHIEDALSITDYRLFVPPSGYPGTADWQIWYGDIQYPIQGDPIDYDPSATGTAVDGGNIQIRGPMAFEVITDDNQMAQLKDAAEAGDEGAYLQVAKNMIWGNRPPEDFIRGIKLAFAAGAHKYAQLLANEGSKRHPDHQELRKYAKILAPPEVIQSNLPPDSTLQSNRSWLKTHRNEYKGQWVALQNGKLLGSALTLRELKKLIDRREGILFTRVP
ncbi:MAG: DUF5678 domain-containing protein [Anaerolineales bacterium]|jgi:hypothetical protein